MEHPFFVHYLPHVHPPPPGRRQLGLAVICVAMFISAVDATIVNVALPDLSRDLSARFRELQWVLDGFLVCLAGMLLVGSGLADRFGRKRVFLWGLAGFTLSSVLAAASSSALELIGARILMGASAACVLPPALSLLAVMFGPEERRRALLVWVMAAGLGFSLGPALGGALVHAFGWQAVFLVNVPFTLGALAAGSRALPESRRPGTPPLDLIGVGLSIIGLASIVFALIDGPDAGWTDAPVLATGISGAAALLVFGRVEARRRAPLFDVTALRRRRVLGGVSTLLANYFSLLGVLFVVPQYLQYVHGESALVAGLTLAPLGAGTVITAPFSGRIRARLGTRLTIAGPLVATVGGFALLLFLGGGASVALVVISMAVFGSAIALFAPPATAVIMDDLGEAKAGDGGAINQLARQVGGALGVAVVGSVFAAVYAAKVDHVLQSFPSASRNVAAKSIEEAKEVISSVPATVHEHLLPRVTHAFDLGARAGIAVAVIVLLAAATVVMVTLRSSATSRG